MKKLLTALLALIMVFACVPFAACTPKDDSEKVDKNKTQLYVGIFEGGWGREWIDLMKVEFEKQYPTVQVMIEGKKAEFQNTTLEASILAGQNDMYFTTISPYSAVAQENDGNKLLDITSTVTTPIKDILADAADPSAFANETKTIEQKMDPYLSTYMKSASKNKDKYFTIPLYTSFYNIVYDVDLFEEKGYFISSKNAGEYVWTTGLTGAPAKWAGQDGVLSTADKVSYDDGLPVTYEDFKALCAKLSAENVSPIIWASEQSGYRSDYFATVWANYIGGDEYKRGLMQDGSTSSEFGIPITHENAYELQKSQGKKAALTMAYDIINNGWFDGESKKVTYLEAQDTYVYSKKKSESGGKRIAMLMEGGWWENECKATRESMAATYGEGYENRRFGVMTIPRFEDTAGITPQQNKNKVLYSVTTNSTVFIKKNTEKAELAKKFMAFTTTDEMLRLYTRVTGSTRMYDYALTTEDLAEMSYYKRNLWDYFSDDKTEIVYTHGPAQMALLNQSYFRNEWNWSASTTGRNFTEPISIFMNYPDATIDEYMNALYESHKNGWQALRSSAGLL